MSLVYGQPGVFAALVWRDGDVCHLCGQPATADDVFEIDHRRSLAQGGSNQLDNLALAHGSCNRLKGATSITEEVA